MKKIFYIVKREYITRVRTRLFLVGTILTPLIFVGIIFASFKFATMRSSDQKTLALVDESGRVTQLFTKSFQDKLADGRPAYVFENVPIDQPIADIQARLSKEVLAKKLDGYLLFSRDVLEDGKAEFHARNVSDLGERSVYTSTLSNVITGIRLRDQGVDPEKIESLTRRAKITLLKVSEAGDREDRGQSFMVTYVLVMILYTTILVYGITVMRSVIEEKTSRVVEVMLSAVSPSELMAGKIIGVSLVAMTQYLIWAASAALVSVYGLAFISTLAPNAVSYIPKIPLSVLAFFVMYFILGFVLFAALYAAIGAMVNNDQEAQQVQMPITVLVVIPILMMGLVMRSPDSSAAVSLSLVPFFTPILMFMRITVQMPPVLQILASIAIMLVSIVFFIWLSAKIYRVGILMYGKRPTLPELVRWLRYS
ncbi:MAG: ABC transporter permease [Acidobacteriia bacterium]|nr:ABC transporter permease [Terriglobia bacterium]